MQTKNKTKEEFETIVIYLRTTSLSRTFDATNCKNVGNGRAFLHWKTKKKGGNKKEQEKKIKTIRRNKEVVGEVESFGPHYTPNLRKQTTKN